MGLGAGDQKAEELTQGVHCVIEKVRMGQRRLRKSGREAGRDPGETGDPCLRQQVFHGEKLLVNGLWKNQELTLELSRQARRLSGAPEEPRQQ